MHIMYWIHLLSKPSMYTKSFYVFRQNSNQDDISIKMTDSSPEHNPWHCLLFRCCLSSYNSWRWGELFFKFFKNSRELWILKNCSFTFLLIAMCCFTYNSVFALSGPATISNQNISRSSLAVPSPSLWSLCSLTSSLSPSLLAPQSGALRISAYRDFQSNPTHTRSTYSFRAFKPFYSDQKQCK